MHTTTSKDGTVIAFDTSGEGPALIVVGGAMSARADVTELAGVLAKDFTVYAYDRRGRGDSGDTQPYAVEREIQDIAALIAEAGGSAFVFGHSSGAVLAIRAAAAGLAIPKLAVYEPPFIVDDARPIPPSDYSANLREMITAGHRGDALEYFMTAAVMMPREAVAGMRHSPMWSGMEAIAPTLLYDDAIMDGAMTGSPEPLRQWATLAVPTLVIDGGASAAWMHHSAEALAETLPNARRQTLEGQDHGAAASVLAPVLVSFFTGE